MKTITIKKSVFSVLETMSMTDIRNSYFGGSNLTADYLNSYNECEVNRFVSDWIESNINRNPIPDGLEVSDILENPDAILRAAASEFFYALSAVSSDAEWVLRNCESWFDAWGNFYVFARQWSNACCDYWIIRACDESEAYAEIIERFEGSFAIGEDDASEETERNDSGNPVNTNGLVLIAQIKGA